MTNHRVATREEWLAERLDLLEAEKELTHARRRGGETAAGAALGSGRQGLSFETDGGEASLADLFRGRSQLLVYHFMFGPDYRPAALVLGDRRRLQRLLGASCAS